MLLESTHVPPLPQLLPQHWVFEEHAPPATTQVLAVEHVEVAGLQ
jgi:hypothetical protein